jgi:hypothetical protein
MAGDKPMILSKKEAKYFCRWGWTEGAQNNPSGKSVCLSENYWHHSGMRVSANVWCAAGTTKRDN